MIILKYSFNFSIDSNIREDTIHEAVIQRYKITSLEYFLSPSFISNTSYPYAANVYVMCVFIQWVHEFNVVKFQIGLVKKLAHFYSITVSRSIYDTGSMRLLL